MGIHVDEDPAAPGVDFDLGERFAPFVQRSLPVLRIEYKGVLTFQVEGPAMKAANERPLLTAGTIGTRGRADQPASAMRAHIVISLERIGRRADDQDRVVA